MVPLRPNRDPQALHTQRILLLFALGSSSFSLFYVFGRDPAWAAFALQQIEALLFVAGAWAVPRLTRPQRAKGVAAILAAATALVMGAAHFAGEAPVQFILVLPLVVSVMLPDDVLPVVVSGVSCMCAAAAMMLWEGWVQPASYLGTLLIIAFAATFGARRYADTRRQLEELRRLRQEQTDQQRLATVGEAAAAVAHEVRNPLAAISNAVTLIRTGAVDSRPLLDMIREEVAKLERFVTDLLVLARPFTARTRTLELGPLLERCARIAGEPATSARFVLKGTGEGRGTAKADPDLLEIALINLMRNALQASPEGASVTVECHSTAGSCVISVEDEGPGVPPEVRARLFEPFFTTKQTGTGLGLAITKRVIAAHQGQIHLKAGSVGRGSRFEIELPQT